MLKNFIFDIDGTLLDTINMYLPPLKIVLEKHGYVADEKAMRLLFGITSSDILRGLNVKDEDIDLLLNEWFDLAYKNTDKVKVFDGVDEALNKLSKLSNINLVVATSKNIQEYKDVFEKKYDIAKYFNAYVTADDTSKHKPDPDPVIAGFKKVNGTPEESIYIGDTLNDLKAAHAAGAKFGAALWGSAQPEKLTNADYLLKTPKELLYLV